MALAEVAFGSTAPGFWGKTVSGLRRRSTLSAQTAHLLYCVANLTLRASKVNDDTVEVNQEAVNQDYEAAYSEESFWKKIAAAAIRAGKESLLMILTLYYCLQDPDTPPKAKAIIVAALGYFIVPFDAIIDIVPGGYADDLGVLAMAFAIVLSHIKAEHRQRANEKLALLLGEAGSDRSQDTQSTPGSND